MTRAALRKLLYRCCGFSVKHGIRGWARWAGERWCTWLCDLKHVSSPPFGHLELLACGPCGCAAARVGTFTPARRQPSVQVNAALVHRLLCLNTAYISAPFRSPSRPRLLPPVCDCGMLQHHILLRPTPTLLPAHTFPPYPSGAWTCSRRCSASSCAPCARAWSGSQSASYGHCAEHPRRKRRGSSSSRGAGTITR